MCFLNSENMVRDDSLVLRCQAESVEGPLWESPYRRVELLDEPVAKQLIRLKLARVARP
jgi:hypothetical protein